jgi:hypothetical protein
MPMLAARCERCERRVLYEPPSRRRSCYQAPSLAATVAYLIYLRRLGCKAPLGS